MPAAGAAAGPTETARPRNGPRPRGPPAAGFPGLQAPRTDLDCGSGARYRPPPVGQPGSRAAAHATRRITGSRSERGRAPTPHPAA